MSARWVCPDCSARSVDINAALEHEERSGHGMARYDKPPTLHRPPAVRNTDPDTSHEAAEQTETSSVSDRIAIMRAWTDGSELNTWEARRKTSAGGECYWKRVSELLAMGWLEPTGDKRPGKTRVKQRVLRATDVGLKGMADR